LALADLAAPLPLDDLIPGAGSGAGPWEVEIGFGKGKYLLSRAIASPERRFLGIEVAAEYHRLFAGRARRRGLSNWVAIRGEALYLASAVLPRAFALAVHVYFPDPWPKSRHQKRRLFDPETVDLVLGLLRPGGRLSFATDFLAYGEEVAALLAGWPGVEVERCAAWPEGPRTHYEAKYEAEGRPIIRIEARLEARIEARLEARLEAPAILHPHGAAAVVGPSRLDT
jgi:tRNA (guanine-N7-)-methyltransferase